MWSDEQPTELVLVKFGYSGSFVLLCSLIISLFPLCMTVETDDRCVTAEEDLVPLVAL